MADHERIWLQNPAVATDTEGRMWCQDKVWPEDAEEGEPTEYVRADLYAALLDELARLRGVEARAAEVMLPFADAAKKSRFLDLDYEPLVHEETGLSITLGDLRAARTFLNSLKEAGKDG